MPKPAELIEELIMPNGIKLPSIDGGFFCSRRDPVREALSWLKAQERFLSPSSSVVILGLGAGFHLQLLPSSIHSQIQVIELRPELIERWKKLNPDSKIPIVSTESEILGATILDFRPAWTGSEAAYENLSRNLRGASRTSLQAQAEKKDLWILAEALKQSSAPENLDLTIKDIAQAIAIENQSEEARLWRALRELVL
jgi:hypothetical protein